MLVKTKLPSVTDDITHRQQMTSDSGVICVHFLAFNLPLKELLYPFNACILSIYNDKQLHFFYQYINVLGLTAINTSK